MDYDSLLVTRRNLTRARFRPAGATSRVGSRAVVVGTVLLSVGCRRSEPGPAAEPSQPVGLYRHTRPVIHELPLAPDIVQDLIDTAADLAAHDSQVKFAFFHFPTYSANSTEASDTALQGPSPKLEGLLGTYGVDIAFSGHAHTYARTTPSASGMPVTYVTGGGGATTVTQTGSNTCSNLYCHGGWTGSNGTITNPAWAGGSTQAACGTCHGTAGNGYTFLKLYRRTRNQVWLDRARAFACRISDQVRVNSGRNVFIVPWIRNFFAVRVRNSYGVVDEVLKNIFFSWCKPINRYPES